MQPPMHSPSGSAGPVLHRRDRVDGSTQDEARDLVRSGAPTPLAVLTRDQRAGRGRLGRSWSVAPGDGIALTLAHCTSVGPERRSWYPLVAGLAVLETITTLMRDQGSRADLGVKWPNDIVTRDGRKLGGILVEAEGPDHLLIGVGINLRPPAVPVDALALEPAWLLGEGGLLAMGRERDVDAPEESFDAHLADSLEMAAAALDSRDGDAGETLRERYAMTCLTVGQQVRVLPWGQSQLGGTTEAPLCGRAVGIDSRGRLLVDTGGAAPVPIDMGDVHRVRPDDAPRRWQSIRIDGRRTQRDPGVRSGGALRQ